MTSSNERQKQTLRDLLRNMNLFTLIIISLSAKLTSAIWKIDDASCKMILEKRHGDSVFFGIQKYGKLSEKSVFATCLLYKFTDKSVRELYIDGLYIAGHKYFGKDPRKGSVKPELFKKFPTPEVTINRKLKRHVWLQMACQKSGKDCVNALYNFGGHKSGTVRNFLYNNVTIPSYNPFGNEQDAFVYKTIAMYYLCWYTMKRDPAMKFYFKEPPKIYQTDPKLRYDIDVSCLGQLYETKDIPQNLRDTIIKTKDKTKISDYRVTYENMKANPFLCAELWFCPDPCYPGMGGFNPSQDLRQSGNPCRKLKNPKCQVVPEANVNFRDLITNRFNVSCRCESSRNKCPKQCVNTDGGYMCTFPRGTTENPRTGESDAVVSPEMKVTTTQYPSSDGDEEIIALSPYSSNFDDSSSSDDAQNELFADRQKGIDKSSDSGDLPSEESENEPFQEPDIVSKENTAIGTKDLHTKYVSEKPVQIDEDTKELDTNNVAEKTVQPDEKNKQPEVINYDIHSSSGKERTEKHIQRKSGLKKGGTVKGRDLKEETKRFLSGFMGFVSSGTKVAPSWLLTFGTIVILFHIFRHVRC